VGGCGSGYDCWTLAKHGWQVTGLDLSPTAVERAQQLLEQEQERQRQQQGGQGEAWPGSVEFVCGDFFALPEETEGHKFDLIFDYTVRAAVCVSDL
jgi:methyl halide transferase